MSYYNNSIDSSWKHQASTVTYNARYDDALENARAAILLRHPTVSILLPPLTTTMQKTLLMPLPTTMAMQKTTTIFDALITGTATLITLKYPATASSDGKS